MAKYIIDMNEWTITNTINSKVYVLGPQYKTLLKTVLENSGGIASYKDFHNNRTDIEPHSYNYDRAENLEWIRKAKENFRTALMDQLDAPGDLVHSLVKSSPKLGYFFDQNKDLFEVTLPINIDTPALDQDPNLDSLVCFIKTVDRNRASAFKFNNKYFPDIKLGNKDVNLCEFTQFITDKTDDINCVVLEGSIGSGKTFMLHKIKSNLDNSYYPIYIDAEELDDLTISEYVLTNYINQTSNQGLTFSDYIREIDNIGSMTLLMIDSWDYLDHKKETSILKEILTLLKANKALKIVISTRHITRNLLKNICGNRNILSCNATLKELPDTVLNGYDKSNFFYHKKTPLVASIHNEIEQYQTTIHTVHDKYHLYTIYFDHLFSKQIILTSQYQEIYPYLGYISKNEQKKLDYDLFNTLEEKSKREYYNIFVDIPFPSASDIQNDLIKSKLLLVDNSCLMFRHDDIRDYVAAQFIKIKLIYGGDINSILDPLIQRIVTHSVSEIFKTELNYCEFCFKTVFNYYTYNSLSSEEEITLLKLGLSIGYHTGYTVFKELKSLIVSYIDNCTKSPQNVNLSIISSINDFIYESLTTELPYTEKVELIVFSEMIYTKCINLLENFNELFFIDNKYLFGSIKSIIGYNNQEKYVNEALLGSLYGNRGATKIEKAKHLCAGDEIYRSLIDAISDHEVGQKYKQKCKIPHQRSLISIATDHYYIATKGIIDTSQKIAHLQKAISYYEYAEHEIKHINYMTIDKFVIPLNKAGCYNELLKYYDNNISNMEKIKEDTSMIIQLLNTGIHEIKKHIEEILTPQPIHRNIDNLYKDLKDKYMPLISGLKKKAQLSDDHSKELLKEFKKELINFVDIYNLLYPYANLELSKDKLNFKSQN